MFKYVNPIELHSAVFLQALCHLGNCLKLRKVTRYGINYLMFSKVAQSCIKVQKIAQKYLKLRKVAQSYRKFWKDLQCRLVNYLQL